LHGLADFGLASQSINATGPLLYGAGVPSQVMMDDMPAVPLKVNAFTHDLAAD